jgi:hypothetical protein
MNAFFVEYRPEMEMSIPDMEAAMLTLPQEPAPVIHRFAPGIYIREVFLPGGTFAIGHEQTTEHLNVMLKGKVHMADGTTLEAPAMYIGKPGRKAGFIVEDTVWLNIYATEETDVEKLEATYLNKSETFKNHGIEQMGTNEAREDFTRMLDDLGVTAELVDEQSRNESDQIPMPAGSYKFQVAPSQIHGRGVFSCGGYEAGETIGEGNVKGCRTPLGRYTNHSGTPNARMVRHGSGINLVALRPIEPQRGGQLGEEITVDYRQARMEALKCLA